MPPKTYKGKQPTASKGKQPVASSSCFNAGCFISSEFAQRFQSDFAHRTMIFERIVVQNDLQNTNFLHWIHRNRLMSIMNLSHPCFEEWVREFYCNMFDVTIVGFKTFVRGKTLTVDANRIAALLDLQRPKNRSYPYSDPDDIVIQVNQVASVLCGKPTIWSNSYLKTSDLTTDYRLLNTFVCHNIEPRSHKSDLLSSQAFLLYSLGTSTSVDIPMTILESMVRVYSEARQLALPFGAICSKLMMEAGCQPYTNELPIARRQKINGKTKALSDTQVTRIRKRGQATIQSDDAETDSIENRLSAIENAVFDQSIQIEQLDERVTTGFSQLDERVATGFSDIRNQLTEMFNQLRHQ